MYSLENVQSKPSTSKNIQQDLIFDVGLHKGEDTEFYLKKGFRVVGIEASSELCEVASQRLSSYVTSGQLTILNAAITRIPGSNEVLQERYC